MRSILLFLVVLILATATVHANQVVNYSFEEGTWTSVDDAPEGWTVYEVGGGSVSWYDDAAGAHDGSRYIGIVDGSWPGMLGESGNYLPCTPGETWYAGGYIKGPTSGDCTFWAGFEGADGIANSFNPPSETEWTYVEAEVVVPAGATATGFFFVGFFNSSEVFFDSVYYDTVPGPPGGSGASLVYDPDPANGALGVPPTTKDLSWKRLRSEECPDANSMVEVWWGTQGEPNFWVDSVKIMNLADVDTFNLDDAITGAITLIPDEYYYWGLKYDPNACDPGDELVEGPAWSFDTINSPPDVDAGLHYEKWQNGGGDPVVIGLDASYTDDGLPVGGVITHSWNTVSNVTYIPHQFCQDPNITISAAGDYVLTLTVNDGEVGSDGSDSILIRVFGNGDDRLRAHYQLDGNTTDIDEGHPASLVDNPGWGTGQVVGAVELDGSDDVGVDGMGDHVSIDDTGSDPNFQPDTWENSDLIDGMTVSAWMKLDEDGWSTSWEAIVTKNNSSWELGRNSSNAGVRFVVQEGIGEATGTANTDLEIGWHQVVGVYDRNTVKLYVDGLEAGSVDAGTLDLEAESNFDKDGVPINDYDWQVPKASGKVRIGAGSNVNADGTPQDLAFAGLIDQVRIFDAAVPHRSEHAGTPGIVEMYRADGGHDNCGGVYVPGDVDEDCYVTLVDIAMLSTRWQECNNIADASCD